MDLALLVDFGSTFTKLALIDLDNEVLVGRAQSESTVNDDMMKGFNTALSSLLDHPECNRTGIKEESIDRKLACSSAAGGLQLVAVGLVPQLTLEAARRAALGAGAKVVGSYSHRLTQGDIEEIERNPCDVLLLSGGTDGGETVTVIHNARMLAKSKLRIPFIVAANRVASPQAVEILEKAGKHVTMTENVLPELDEINVEPARKAIRETFVKRIVNAKGLDKAERYLGGILMPTPMATLKAAELLAKGAEESGMGELMVVEVGGATTNVHSAAAGIPTQPNAVPKGLPEPYAKRTVEGDLGIRYNAATIVELAGEKRVLGNIAMQGESFDRSRVRSMADLLSSNVGYIPQTKEDFLLDNGLARTAIDIAVGRHAGRYKETWTPEGTVLMQYGKDLTSINTLIGTGGIFAYGRVPELVLQAGCYSSADPISLRPKGPTLFIDRSYIVYAIGLLSEIVPDKAIRLAKKYLCKIMAPSSV